MPPNLAQKRAQNPNFSTSTCRRFLNTRPISKSEAVLENLDSYLYCHMNQPRYLKLKVPSFWGYIFLVAIIFVWARTADQ